MGNDRSIVILDGARRTPRADILINNKEPGLFSRFSDNQMPLSSRILPMY